MSPVFDAEERIADRWPWRVTRVLRHGRGLFHLRLVVPPESTPVVIGRLRAHPATFDVALFVGAAIDPPGDIVTCDLAREAVNDVVDMLRRLDLHRLGSIAIERVDVSISDAAAAAERRAPGYGSDAAVWEEVEARVRDESHLTAGFVAFLVVAAIIAAAGLIEDSAILVVGAMVVGPEFGPIAGLAVGLFKRRWNRVRSALVTLTIGFAAGIVAAYLATLAADAAGIVPVGFSPHTQPVTGFVTDPSWASFVVAFFAGIAGTLSLTQAKAGALIGVLISVTTIPALAAVGVSAAVDAWEDAGAALAQLTLNVFALVVAGVLTLWAQRTAWDRLSARAGASRAYGNE
jgi:uncharacterized hydrophobic protein (TIGR00271 family)